MSEFSFDCPTSYQIINKAPISSLNDNHALFTENLRNIDPWFLVVHEDYRLPENKISNDSCINYLLDPTIDIFSSPIKPKMCRRSLVNKRASLSTSNSISDINHLPITKNKLLSKDMSPDQDSSNAVSTRRESKSSIVSSSHTGHLRKHSLSYHSTSGNRIVEQPLKKVRQLLNRSTLSVHKQSNNVKETSKKQTLGGILKGLDIDMVDLLRKHNGKFSSAKYEPPKHSIRQVRAWEKKTGKIWSELSIEDKEIANKEISSLITKGSMK